MSNEPSGRDPLLDMTESEIRDECLNIVGYPGCAQPIYPYHNLVGLIIAKLQEWNISFSWEKGKWKTWPHGLIVEGSLQVAFLRTAQALGHWSTPKKVEPEVEYWRNKATGEVWKYPFNGTRNCGEWERITVTPYKEDK